MLSNAGLLILDRDENTKRPLPRRLQELVAQYPYTTSPDRTADGLLTRPRFSTRRHDALFVRVEAAYTANVQIPSRSPVDIFIDALESEAKSDVYLWDQVKAATTSNSDDRPLPAILSDDTINLLSLASTDPRDQLLLGVVGAAPTIVTPLSPVTETPLSAPANGNGVPSPVHKPTLLPSTPQSPKDWAEFSSAGFGGTSLSRNFASTLLDKDLEVTEPPVRRKSSKLKLKSTTSTRRSVEASPLVPKMDAPEEPEGPKLVLVATEVVQLDEAFIDFWRDAVVDPISSDWPQFVIGELKHPLNPREGGSGGPINWIIIEEKVKRPAQPPTPVISHEALTTGGPRLSTTPLKRTSSPRPSFGDKKSSLSATFKRFTLFGGSKDDLAEDFNPAAGGSGKKDGLGGKKKGGGASKSPTIGELGDVLSEEPEPLPEVPEKREVVAAAAGVVGGAAMGAVLAGSDERKVDVVKGVPQREEAKAIVTRKDDKLPAPPRGEGKDKVPIPNALVTEREVPTSAVEEPEQARKPLPEVPPVVEEPPQGPAPALSLGATPDLEPVVETESDPLPPAPESIVSHGETPGPQLALDSTEVGLHHVPEPTDVSPTADSGTQSLEPTIEHLEDMAEDPAADVGVDLDPVPIVPSDPVESDAVDAIPTPTEGHATEQDPEPTPTQPEDTPPLSPNDPASEEPTPQSEETATRMNAVTDVPAECS